MSRTVRELHLLRYGATSSQLQKGLSEPPGMASKAAIDDMVNRLHTSDASKRSSSQQAYRSRQQRDSAATLNMPTLFPCYQEPTAGKSGSSRPQIQDEDLYGITISKPIVSGNEVPNYPVDWRRNPSSAHEDDTLRWLYLCVTLPLLPSREAVTSETIKAIDRLLAHHDVPIVASGTRRRDVRSMLRDSRRYGLLIDIISTRRTVMSGTPHAAATDIYRHCEERYPIYIKFAFVGITDNGTKRVARDIFSGGRVPAHEALPTGYSASRSQRKRAPQFVCTGGRKGANSILVSSEAGGGRAMPFTAVDSVHCFIAHPKSDEADLLRIKGEQERRQREAELIARRYTPKYVPPPPPEWLQKLLEAESSNHTQSRKQVANDTYNEVSRPSSGKARLPVIVNDELSSANGTILDIGESQWLFGKSFGGTDVMSQASPVPHGLGSAEAPYARVGAYLPEPSGSPISASKNELPQLAQEPSQEPPKTREQHYLSLAQTLSKRLRATNPGNRSSASPTLHM